MKLSYLGAFGAAVLLGSSSAIALAAPPVVNYTPPAGFSPLTASNDALTTYGLPPKPNKDNVEAYSAWLGMVTNQSPRVDPKFHADFNGLPVQHGPMKLLGNGGTENGASVNNPTVNSTNWVGDVVVRQYTSGVTIYASFVIPSVHLPSICNGYGAFLSQWPGFDGFNDNVVRQAGALSAVTCAGEEYIPSLWYQAYPETTSIFFGDAQTGDAISVAVTVSGSTMQVYAIDLSRNEAWSFTQPLTQPSPLQSAEWIDEAPYVGGAPSVLAVPSNNADGSAHDSTANPASNPTSAVQYSVNMYSPFTGKEIAWVARVTTSVVGIAIFGD